jgi:hypothetical protein
MSRHTSRKERWIEVNAKEHRAAFGVVRYVKGAWEGTVRYELWHDGEDPAWRPEEAFAGRFKRPRNAMIAVEDKAREIARRLKEKAKVQIEDD